MFPLQEEIDRCFASRYKLPFLLPFLIAFASLQKIHTHTYIYTSCALTVCTTSEILNISLTIQSRPAQLSMAAIRHSIIAAIALCSRVASRKQKVEDFIVRRYDSGINFYFRAIIKEISRIFEILRAQKIKFANLSLYVRPRNRSQD